MDYSSLPNDPDHPVGTSPWQSSPRANQHEEGIAPSSPLAKHSTAYVDTSPQQSEDGSGHGQLDDATTLGGEDGPQPIPDRARGLPSNGEGVQGQQPYHQQSQYRQQQRQQQGTPYQQPHQQQQQQPRSAVPSRYHTSGVRSNQRLPQYKLQAKITGLERTGRKDPILRFDVHVGPVSLTELNKSLLIRSIRLIYPNSAPPNSGMSAAHTQNLQNWRTT